jgi:hypothetical protein
MLLVDRLPAALTRSRRASLTAHLGQRSLTVRLNRSLFRFGRTSNSAHVGTLTVGLVAMSWLRRPPGGGRRWGFDRQQARLPS